MGYLAVILAAAGAFVFGAVWYSIFAAPWKADSGVTLGEDGKPVNATSPNPYVICFVSLLIVAGFMRLLLESVAILGFANALQWGIGIGLFFIAPWIALNNGYATRPFRLSMIDGGYAALGCGIMSLVLYWLAPNVG